MTCKLQCEQLAQRDKYGHFFCCTRKESGMESCIGTPDSCSTLRRVWARVQYTQEIVVLQCLTQPLSTLLLLPFVTMVLRLRNCFKLHIHLLFPFHIQLEGNSSLYKVISKWIFHVRQFSRCIPKLYGKKQTLLQVLNSCQVALQLHQYNRRHNCVLEFITNLAQSYLHYRMADFHTQ